MDESTKLRKLLVYASSLASSCCRPSRNGCMMANGILQKWVETSYLDDDDWKFLQGFVEGTLELEPEAG